MAEQPQAPKGKPKKSATAAESRSDSITGQATAAGSSFGAAKKERGRDLSGTTLGDFTLLRKIGSGGMGEVYLAQQVSLKRQVALKLLRSDHTEDETALKRFKVEAEAAAKLTHANIVQIYALSQQDGTNYMALEYVQGMNLRDYVTKKGPASAKFAVKVMEQVAAALQHAADAGVVHRDIKPDNILLTRRGEVKVADFGLARLRMEKPVNLTQTGVTMGTPLYMSPEQVEGKQLDPRSDLYSFGVTCYFMLAGQPPFRGESALAVAVQHIKGQPEPLEKIRPDLPPELCRMVQKLMAKEPDQRYQTGRQIGRDLQKLRAELATEEKDTKPEQAEPQEADPTTVPLEQEPSKDRMQFFRLATIRRNLVWWIAASIVVALGGGAGYGWYHRAPDLQPNAGEVPPSPPPVPWQELEKQTTAKSQYEYALAVGQFSNAEAAWMAVINYWSSEPDWVRRAQLQIGKHYLDEHQLDKAEKHFNEMASSLDTATQLAGKVGLAAVLSSRDHPQESLDALWNVVKDGGIGSDRMLMGMVFWTFERNYRNLGVDWDPEVRRWANSKLEQFRTPQSAPRSGAERTQPNSPGRS